MAELACDVLIAGGGLGGCAAALAAARLGRAVILTEEAVWIGGQLTAQAVSCPDEHPWIEQFGATRSYYELRNGVRDYYRRHYPISAAARATAALNPGGGSVSRVCAEPRAWLAVLHALLAPYRAAGRVVVMAGHRPVLADAGGDRVRSVTFRDLARGEEVTVAAPLVLDATELGDLLPLTRTEYVCGAESYADTGEPHARAGVADPEDVQSFTVCFAMEYRPGEEWTVPRPDGYEAFRASQPLEWTQPHPITRAPRLYSLFDQADAFSLWRYRRILDRSQFVDGAFPSDLTLVNWPHNDYFGGSLIDKLLDEQSRLIDAAKRLSLSLLHWLQTEAPRPDGGAGWPGLRLRPDVVGTADGLAQYPYVRESRRILPLFRVLEPHIAADSRLGQRLGERFPDSVGIGLYRIDLHPSSHGVGYVDIGCCPFEIPLGALIPRRTRNLLAAGKNIGTTHVTNGAYRLHPVEWNVGEAAGALAAFCLERRAEPHAVRESPDLLAEFQRLLQDLGVPLHWPQPGPV